MDVTFWERGDATSTEKTAFTVSLGVVGGRLRCRPRTTGILREDMPLPSLITLTSVLALAPHQKNTKCSMRGVGDNLWSIEMYVLDADHPPVRPDPVRLLRAGLRTRADE